MIGHTTKKSSQGNHKIKMPHSLGVVFAWNFTNELDIAIPNVEVVLYKAKDINDDRFKMINNSNFIDNESEVMIFELAIAQSWITPCDQSGKVHTANCHDAKMIKQVLLKPGSYVYLYRVNGSFQLGKGDKLTVLATKRKVHYVDVRREDTVSYDQDAVGTESLQTIRETTLHNDVTANTELLRSFASVREMYSLNITVNGGRVTPLEKCVWNRVEKEMAARFKVCDV
eukprot:Seg190.19 transcript_id=Seg190.19/GoldUCD/mRNA.D3Y31 product="hypothetical protein" protein_id=Seg190.19/GoldUCD/D3Y31